jgi:transposase
MISMHDFEKIRELARNGLKPAKIAAQLSINRKTVTKYLASNSPPCYPKERDGRTREDHFLVYEERVKVLLKPPSELSNVEIFEMIKDEGYKGSERTVQRRIAVLKSERPKERFFEQEYQPGEQSQFDFKESVDIAFHDGVRKVQFVFGTLPCSDKFFIKGYPRTNFECFIDGIHSFFESVGGMTKNIRIDNLSPCVSKVYKGSRRQYTESFERVIRHYGFGVLPCSPGRGNEKGDVERDIRTHAKRIKNLIVNQGTIFSDFNHLNQWLETYIAKRTSDKINDSFEEERKFLLPLPAKDESVLCRIEECTSTSYGTVHVGDYFYSVPDSAIQEKCLIVAGPYDLKVYRKSPRQLVAAHSRLDGDSILLEHVIPSLVRKPQAMVRWAHRDILFQNENLKQFYKKLQKHHEGSAETIFLKCVNLIQYTTLSEISTGMELIMGEEFFENPYEDLRCLLLGERRPDNVTNISARLEQQKLNPNLKDFDQLIPKGG